MVGQLCMFCNGLHSGRMWRCSLLQLITQAALVCHLLMHNALLVTPTAAYSMQGHSKTQCMPLMKLYITGRGTH